MKNILLIITKKNKVKNKKQNKITILHFMAIKHVVTCKTQMTI